MDQLLDQSKTNWNWWYGS